MNINSVISEAVGGFVSNSSPRMNDKTTIASRLYRLIQDENYAITGYSEFLSEFKSKLPKKVISIIEDIIHEEKVHVGELISCLTLVDPDYISALKQAKKETE